MAMNRASADAWDEGKMSQPAQYAVAAVSMPPGTATGASKTKRSLGGPGQLQFQILQEPGSMVGNEYQVVEDMENNPILQCSARKNIVKMTDKRVIVTWVNQACCGACSTSIEQSMFPYRDIVDINIGSDSSKKCLWWALGIFIFSVFVGGWISARASVAVGIILIIFGILISIVFLIHYLINEILNGGVGVAVDLCKQNVGVGSWALGFARGVSTNANVTTTVFWLPRADAFTFAHAVLQHPDCDLLHGLKGHTITDRSRIATLQPALPV